MFVLYCLRGRDLLGANKGSMRNRTHVNNQSNLSIHLVYSLNIICVCIHYTQYTGYLYMYMYVHAYECTSSYTYVATGSRKRPRPSPEDESVSRVKQSVVLSDQSTKANDIGPAPVVY